MLIISTAFLNGVNRALSVVRSSIEMGASDFSGSQSSEIRKAYHRFEEIRLAYSSQVRAMKRGHIDGPEIIETLRRNIVRYVEFDIPEEVFRLRNRGAISPRDDILGHLHPALFDRGINIGDYLMFLAESLESIPYQEQFSFDDSDAPRGQLSASAIRKAVPQAQALAPIQFSIESDKIIILHQSSSIKYDNKANADSARSSLIESGRKIAGELEKSNCDRRLLETILDLNKEMESEQDIIRLGLSNIRSGIMFPSFRQELPDAVFAMLQSHNVGISMYVGQFEDWQRFSEQAAISDITDEDASTIFSATSEIVNDIKSNPEVSDSEVPKTLAAINDLISDPKNFSKKAAYATLRSVENLIIKVFNYGADFIDESVKKTIDKVSTGVAITMMTLVIGGASILSPLGNHLPSSAWIQKAVETVQRQLDIL